MLVPPDCVKLPVPPLPTYWLLTESAPPLIVERASFVVRLPPPRLTAPLPESVSPPLRLMSPPEAARIVPWQVTGSLIETAPAKPWPAGTVSVVPSVWVSPKVL